LSAPSSSSSWCAFDEALIFSWRGTALLMEFDYLPFEQLDRLAGALRDAVEPDTFSAPPASDREWWERTAINCDLAPEEATELADSVHSDFQSRDFSLISKQPWTIWIGDLCSTESRLAIQALGIKGICTIASHGIDELWAEDKVNYMTAVVTPSCPIASQIDHCVSFLERHTPAVVCCSSGFGASVLIAVAFLIHTKPSLDVSAAVETVRQAVGGRLDLSQEDLEALQCFAKLAATRTPPATNAHGSAGKKREGEALCPLPPSPTARTEAKKGAVSLERQETTTVSSKRARRAIGV